MAQIKIPDNLQYPFLRPEDTVYLPIEKDSHIDSTYRQQIVEKLDGHNYLAVDGLNIPAFGSRSVALVGGAPVENAGCEAAAAFVLDGDHLQTPFYEVAFDERGYISSLIDRENGRQLKGAAMHSIRSLWRRMCRIPGTTGSGCGYRGQMERLCEAAKPQRCILRSG